MAATYRLAESLEFDLQAGKRRCRCFHLLLLDSFISVKYQEQNSCSNDRFVSIIIVPYSPLFASQNHQLRQSYSRYSAGFRQMGTLFLMAKLKTQLRLLMTSCLFQGY
ncbi:hypothetical protein FGO68_gene2269 [Halteria grandinella]|uniref:Uncharacterized protein n=1 Tax=Halteria grandinella TaxID=5974 RepID=A0A8J8SUL7_HALGN|nr:hypothetical protein FGO68_gene2269 [Halteria grandinella]